MKAPLSTLPKANHSLCIFTSLHRVTSIPSPNSNLAVTPSLLKSPTVSLNPQIPKRLRLIPLSCVNSRTTSRVSYPPTANPVETSFVEENEQENQWRVEVRKSIVPPFVSTWGLRFSVGDRVFFLLTVIACTTSVAFTGLVIAAVPTLFALKRAAISLAKLADVAREELPSTMAAVRLSSMEISDLTLELGDLSKEISEGISKSTQVVKAAEAGIKQMGAVAHQQTISMIEERANLPVIGLQPVVSGAAKKTSRAVGSATRTIMSIFSRQDHKSLSFDDDDDNGSDGLAGYNKREKQAKTCQVSSNTISYNCICPYRAIWASPSKNHITFGTCSSMKGPASRPRG
ncbi:hypothetical protein V2J09_023619 [Rumex salicifolius]